MIEINDLLAGQAATEFFLDELENRRGLHLVSRHQRESIGEDRAVDRVGPAIAHHRQRQMILRRLVDQGIGNAGGHGVDRPG